MNKELSNLFLTSFNNGKIIHLLDKFKNENEDSIYNLYKGIIYLNLRARFLPHMFESITL